MPTDRLYFSDPYLVAFTARVTERGFHAGRPAVQLDRSAFYPEGGGQPADHGTLNGIPVFDVQVDESGAVWHAITGALDADAVEGIVDWTRRFDHMQQHHGQHLLSAAFENLFGFRTVSFHLGTDSATIDLAVKDVTRDHIKAAEDLTNRIIWEDHPVHARFVSREELTTIPLRKAPVVDGPIRVVSAGEFDHSACGGTHPRTTGGVGLLHVRKVERRAAESRVEFVAGGRALRDLRFASSLVGRMATGLTVGPEELEVAVSRLRESEERSHKRVQKLVEELAGFEADRLVADGRVSKRVPVIRLSFSDRSMQDLRYLAGAIAVRGGIAVLGLSGEKSQIIVTRPAESDLDCGKVVKDTLAAFGGKGGGQPAIAQGGVPDPSQLEAALDLAVRNVAAATPAT